MAEARDDDGLDPRRQYSYEELRRIETRTPSTTLPAVSSDPLRKRNSTEKDGKSDTDHKDSYDAAAEAAAPAAKKPNPIQYLMTKTGLSVPVLKIMFKYVYYLRSPNHALR